MRQILACLVLLGGAATCSAEAVLIKTYGRGETLTSAIDAAKRQAMRDATEVLLGGSGKTRQALTPHVDRVRVLHTTRLAAALYEVELEASVSIVHGAVLPRTRVAFLIDPYSMDSGNAISVQSDAISRLGTSAALDVVDNADAPAGRLLDQVRRSAGNRRADLRKSDAASAFDLLFVLSADAPVAAHSPTGGDNLEMRTRVSVIDAATEQVRSVTTVKSSLLRLPTDMHAALVRDAGRQIAGIAENHARQSRRAVKPHGLAKRNGSYIGKRNGVPEVISDGDW